MKSIIEEASSISKAIEKGWARAGKPKNFSVKIYEEPEKNFFGLTTRSAKIALIFDEKTIQVPQEKQPQHGQTPSKTDTRRTPKHKQPNPQETVSSQSKIREPRKKVATPREETSPVQTAEPLIISDDIKQALTSWVSQALPLMGISGTIFNLETSDQTIRVVFDTPLLEDSNQEKALLRSFSYLALAMLRTKFKKGLRNLRLICVKKGE